MECANSDHFRGVFEKGVGNVLRAAFVKHEIISPFLAPVRPFFTLVRFWP